MSRYLAAFRGEDEKDDFLRSPVPNKSEKAKTPPEPPSDGAAEAAAGGFRLFRDIRDQAPGKTRFSREGYSGVRDTAASAANPAAAAIVEAAQAAGDWQAERPPEPPPSLLRRPAGPPTDEMVDLLAEALAARPAHTMTDPVKAMAYFRSDARRRLSLVHDDLVRGLLTGAYRHRLVSP